MWNGERWDFHQSLCQYTLKEISTYSLTRSIFPIYGCSKNISRKISMVKFFEATLHLMESFFLVCISVGYTLQLYWKEDCAAGVPIENFQFFIVAILCCCLCLSLFGATYCIRTESFHTISIAAISLLVCLNQSTDICRFDTDALNIVPVTFLRDISAFVLWWSAYFCESVSVYVVFWFYINFNIICNFCIRCINQTHINVDYSLIHTFIHQ